MTKAIASRKPEKESRNAACSVRYITTASHAHPAVGDGLSYLRAADQNKDSNSDQSGSDVSVDE